MNSPPESLVHVRCLVCNADETTPVITGRDYYLDGEEYFTVVRCRECSLAYLDPRPPLERLPDYYPPTYTAYVRKGLPWIEGAQNAFAWRRFQRMAWTLGPGSRILDVGCGDGRLLALLKAKGFDVRGVEFSAAAVSICRETRGLDVRKGTLIEAGFEDDSFDLVTLFHVLEHVPDPLEVLREVHRILKPDGVVLVEVPDHECVYSRIFGRYWCGWHLPQHLYHFTSRTLSRIFQICGFGPPAVKDVLVEIAWGASFTLLVLDAVRGIPGLPSIIRAVRPFFKIAVLPLGYLLHLSGLTHTGVIEAMARKAQG